MPKTHTPYPDEFRRKMVELVRAGRSPQQLAKEFEPSAQAIRNWIKQADLDSGRRDDGLTSTDKDELQRLRRENRRLKEEREILKNVWLRRRSQLLNESLWPKAGRMQQMYPASLREGTFPRALMVLAP